MNLSPAQREALATRRIDAELTLEVLERCRRGGARELPDYTIPSSSDRIVPLDTPPEIRLPKADLRRLLAVKLAGSPTLPGLETWLTTAADPLVFDKQRLREFGLLLSPLLSLGVLNGGMATSYCDRKKNSAAGNFFRAVEKDFDSRSIDIIGLPKALAPACYGEDGTPGPTFMELRIRAGMNLCSDYLDFLRALGEELPPGSPIPCFPAFHMTSAGTSEALRRSLAFLARRSDMQAFAKLLGVNPCEFLEEVQPLIAAFTHSSAKTASGEREIFWGAAAAEGGAPAPIALPGGHGQNFQTLAPLYRRLHASGKIAAYLANIDNLGAVPEPSQLALLILTGSDASFDFSYKTAVDTKGGILVTDKTGRLSCADIGPAIPAGRVDAAIASGKDVLFNCATGLFDLDWLTANLETIIEELPIRLSDQSKDLGDFSQAELVTWEVLGLMEKPLIFAVDKYKRFLASKLLTDTLVTSGLADKARLTTDEADLAARLERGLRQLLAGPYRAPTL